MENCIALQTSISNFAVSCAVYNRTSNTIRRALRATENFLKSQTGCTIYDVCAQTQLHDRHTLKRILRASNEFTGVLHICGEVSIKTIGLLRNIACEYPTLKVLFSCNDTLILNQITTMMNCVKLEDDHQYNFLTCMAIGGLNEKIFGIVDKHFAVIFPFLQSSLEKLQAELIQIGQGSNDDGSLNDGCQICLMWQEHRRTVNLIQRRFSLRDREDLEKEPGSPRARHAQGDYGRARGPASVGGRC